MGTIQHKAILVTGLDYKDKDGNRLTKAFSKAQKLFPKKSITKITGEGINGYLSFLIAPNGSKLGWERAVTHQDAIDEFIQYLETLKYEDGSTSVKYLFLSYGELGTEVVDYNGNNLVSSED